MVWSAAFVLFIVCSLAQVSQQAHSRSKRCAKTHTTKIVKLGLFYTDKMFKLWKGNSRSDDPTEALQTLVKEVNEWYTPAKLGYQTRVIFKLSSNNIKRIDDGTVDRAVVHGNSYQSAVNFCKIAHERKGSGNWDIAFLLTDKKSRELGATGVVAGIKNICHKTSNCGILLKSDYKRSNFYIFPNLFAHELGHTFGLDHTPGATIMGSPGAPNVQWAGSSKEKMRDTFNDKNELPCLEWGCNEYLANDLASDLTETRFFSEMCSSVDPKFEVFADRVTDKEMQLIKPRTSLSKILKHNPEFFKAENACKGILCREKSKCASCRYTILARTQDDLTRNMVKCGVNKVCNNGKCVFQ